MTRRLVLQIQAEADVDGTVSWYESERAGLGVEFLQDLNVIPERVEENPFQFPILHVRKDERHEYSMRQMRASSRGRCGQVSVRVRVRERWHPGGKSDAADSHEGPHVALSG